MDEAIKKQIQFVLEDENEGMQTATETDSDLNEERRQMNRNLTRRHRQILAKLERDGRFTQQELQCIRDANRIHVNDEQNLNGRHTEAIVLEEWLDLRMELSMEEAMRVFGGMAGQGFFDAGTGVPRPAHTLGGGDTGWSCEVCLPLTTKGKCLTCGSSV